MAIIRELTTGEYARRVGITIKTARAWCDKGKINSYLTPGGHRRIRVISESPPTGENPDYVVTNKRDIPASTMGAILVDGWIDISINGIIKTRPMLHVRRTAKGYHYPVCTFIITIPQKLKHRGTKLTVACHGSGDMAVFVADNYDVGDKIHILKAIPNNLRSRSGKYEQVIEVLQVYKKIRGARRKYGIKRIG